MANDSTKVTLDLEAIEARANAATLGPWVARENPPVWIAEGHDPGKPGWEIDVPSPQDLSMSLLDVSGEFFEGDAEFIAHARTDVPALIAAVRQRDAEIERLRTVERERNAWIGAAFAIACDAPHLLAERLARLVGDRDRLRRERDEAHALLAPVQEAARTIRDADPWESQAAGQHARGDREATLRKAALATIAGEDAP